MCAPGLAVRYSWREPDNESVSGSVAKSGAMTHGHIDTENQEQHTHDPPEHAWRETLQYRRSDGCAEDYTSCRHKDQRPYVQDRTRLRGEIHGKSRAIHEERDGRCGRNERLLSYVKPQHCRGPDTALIAHQTTEGPG